MHAALSSVPPRDRQAVFVLRQPRDALRVNVEHVDCRGRASPDTNKWPPTRIEPNGSVVEALRCERLLVGGAGEDGQGLEHRRYIRRVPGGSTPSCRARSALHCLSSWAIRRSMYCWPGGLSSGLGSCHPVPRCTAAAG